jgi:hypothetical protein
VHLLCPEVGGHGEREGEVHARHSGLNKDTHLPSEGPRPIEPCGGHVCFQVHFMDPSQPFLKVMASKTSLATLTMAQCFTSQDLHRIFLISCRRVGLWLVSCCWFASRAVSYNSHAQQAPSRSSSTSRGTSQRSTGRRSSRCTRSASKHRHWQTDLVCQCQTHIDYISHV